MNSNCSYLCMFCQAVGQIIIDKNLTHKVCSLQAHQEIQKSTIACKHCSSTANSINYEPNLYNKLGSPSNKSIFCDQKCCLCNNLGTTYINQAQYHKICCFIFHKSIFAVSSIYCIHCTSIIPLSEIYFQPPFISINVILFKFDSYSKNFSFSDEKSCTTNIEYNESDSQNNKCLSIQNYDSLSIQSSKISNVPNAVSINIQDDDENNSDYNISSDEEVKANETYQTIKPQIYRENESSESLDLSSIEICYIHKVRHSFTKMYYIYNQNQELPYYSPMLTCEPLAQKPYEFELEIDFKPRANEILVRGERNICKICFIETKKKIESSKILCENCCEACNSQNLKFRCGHKGCNYCYFDGNCCFKCWKIFKAPEEKVCFKCMKIKFPVQLFCGHYICKKCRAAKKIKRFNYCCIECCLSKIKVCLKCKKICRWKIDNDKNLIHKKCCDEYYCSLCFDKRNAILVEIVNCICVKIHFRFLNS